jgi:hypothetical protein
MARYAFPADLKVLEPLRDLLGGLPAVFSTGNPIAWRWTPSASRPRMVAIASTRAPPTDLSMVPISKLLEFAEAIGRALAGPG